MTPTPPSDAERSFREQLAARLQRPSLLDPRAIDRVLAGGFAPRSERGISALFGNEPGAYALADGVATVAINGPLAQRAWVCWMFQGDGYDAIVSRVHAAMQDPAVTSVVLRIDSPGGEVAGCFDAVRQIRQLGTDYGKPLVAYADELAASAAYALASACEMIVSPDTGCVGSIGVVTSRIEETPTDGTKVHVITSGARKADGHPLTPMSEAELASTQGQIDYLADIFAAEVAQARSMSTEDVMGLEAAVFLGTHAVKAGLADKVGNYSTAVAQARKLANAQRKKKNMKQINSALGLSEDSPEAVAIATIDGLKAKAALSDELATKLAAVESDKAQADIAKALAEGDTKAVWTPATRALYAGKSAAEIRAFVSVAPRVIPPTMADPKNPSTANGKRFEEMAPMERAALSNSDPETYKALREDAQTRGAI